MPKIAPSQTVSDIGATPTLTTWHLSVDSFSAKAVLAIIDDLAS